MDLDPPVADDHEAEVYRAIGEHEPATAPAIADRLGWDAALVGAIMARLLDARRLRVVGVTPEGEPV